MKFLVVLALAVACVAADVSHILMDESQAPIIESQGEINPDGSYGYLYKTANGIEAQEQGSLKNVEGIPSLFVKGAYKFNSPEGPIEVSYIADENGFQPSGNHLPVAPPVPEYILRSLRYIAENAPKRQ